MADDHTSLRGGRAVRFKLKAGQPVVFKGNEIGEGEIIVGRHSKQFERSIINGVRKVFAGIGLLIPLPSANGGGVLLIIQKPDFTQGNFPKGTGAH